MVCDLSTGRVGISAGKIAAGSPLCQGLMVETLPASDAGVVLRQFQASGVLLHALLLICDRLWSEAGAPAGEAGAGPEVGFCALAVGALSSIA